LPLFRTTATRKKSLLSQSNTTLARAVQPKGHHQGVLSNHPEIALKLPLHKKFSWQLPTTMPYTEKPMNPRPSLT
ncbi:MAG: hypothetical protein AAGA01_16655, partial [Cyanobacteria bacterium P01_E01_bin.43]